MKAELTAVLESRSGDFAVKINGVKRRTVKIIVQQLGRGGDAREQEPDRLFGGLLLAEVEERERNTIERRISVAHLARMIEEFNYTYAACDRGYSEIRGLTEGGMQTKTRVRFNHRRIE